MQGTFTHLHPTQAISRNLGTGASELSAYALSCRFRAWLIFALGPGMSSTGQVTGSLAAQRLLQRGRRAGQGRPSLPASPPASVAQPWSARVHLRHAIPDPRSNISCRPKGQDRLARLQGLSQAPGALACTARIGARRLVPCMLSGLWGGEGEIPAGLAVSAATHALATVLAGSPPHARLRQRCARSVLGGPGQVVRPFAHAPRSGRAPHAPCDTAGGVPCAHCARTPLSAMPAWTVCGSAFCNAPPHFWGAFSVQGASPCRRVGLRRRLLCQHLGPFSHLAGSGFGPRSGGKRRREGWTRKTAVKIRTSRFETKGAFGHAAAKPHT